MNWIMLLSAERESAVFVSENVKKRVCAVSVSRNGERVSVLSLEVKMWERERVCAVSVSQNGENEFLEDKSIYRQSMSCGQLQMRGIKSKLWI